MSVVLPINHWKKWGFYLFLLLAALAIWIFFPDIKRYGQQFLFWAQREQNALNRTISRTLSALRQGGDSGAWWAVISLGFAYGALHAVGPGHGKAIVTTFLLTQPSSYKSALLLAVGGALLQGLSAILWVGLTFGALNWLIRESVGQVIWAERLSYAMVVVVGVVIIWRQIRRLRGTKKTCGCGHHHAEHHHHNHHHNHHHHDERKHWQTHFLALFAIGLRPCSGAILALAVAAAWKIWAAGVAMIVAMSLGTATTVMTLALLTVFGRDRFAMRLSRDYFHMQWLFHALIIFGGLALVFLGILMMVNSQGAAGMAIGG